MQAKIIFYYVQFDWKRNLLLPSQHLGQCLLLITSCSPLVHMQRVTALHPQAVAMPPPIEVPAELKSYYASLNLDATDVLSFGYQIASAMVSRDTALVCAI